MYDLLDKYRLQGFITRLQYDRRNAAKFEQYTFDTEHVIENVLRNPENSISKLDRGILFERLYSFGSTAHFASNTYEILLKDLETMRTSRAYKLASFLHRHIPFM